MTKHQHKQQTAREALDEQFKAHAAELDLQVDVLSTGPINAEVVLVGEGPGESEVRQGVPFIGGAGSLLFNALRKHGLTRANVYLTNVVKRQISLSRKGNEKHAVYKDELAKWQGLIKWELSQLPNARIIFILGNYALEALTTEHGITNWRGSVLSMPLPSGKTGQLIITINPAYALREPKMEPMFLMDCHKLAQVVNGTFKPHKIEAEINPTARRALDFLRELQASPKPISYDIETINGETACHGLGNSAHHAMCINLRDGAHNRFSTSEEADILLALQKLCDSHKLVAQNGSFDSYWTRLHDWLSVRVWFDTLLAHHTLYPQLPHNLGFLCTQYTTHPFYKDDGKSWREGGDIDVFWRYNCSDVAITYAIHEAQQRELQQQRLDKFFFNHVMHAQPHLVSATVHGLAVDTALKSAVVEQCNEDVERLKADFYRLVHELTEDKDYYPNPNSPQQLRELYFNRLNLRGRGYSTDKANREAILKNPQTSPLARDMLAAQDRYATEAKFTSTFAESKLGPDNRFRCEYKQYGVARAPGRLSSAALLDGQGGNLQNQPVRARSMYVADPGMCFVYFDLAQAEARIVAWRAKIDKWKEQFEQARKDGLYDAHRALASEMFKVPYDKVPTSDWDANHAPTIRYIAKRCRHGLNYRMERYKLAEVTGLPVAQAARAWALYHSLTPELRRWWEAAERDFKRTREAWNALGRRLKVIQRIDDDVLRSIVAFYPQSTVGDKVTQVWYQAEEDDKWPADARICLNVHDNLVAIAPPDRALACLRILKRYAESPILIQDVYNNKPEPLIIPAELKVSYPTIYDPVSKQFKESKHGLHRWSHMRVVKL